MTTISAVETTAPAIFAVQASEKALAPPPPGYDVNDPLSNLNPLPVFATKEEEREHAKQQMAGLFRVFARHGYSEGHNGHISLRDPVEPDTFWINPYAKHFAHICVSDLIRLTGDGQYIEGPTGPHAKVNRAGFIIHSTIHRERPDINVVCHAHSTYGRAWSAFGRGIEMLTQDCCLFYDDLSVYGGFGGVVLASAEGKELAKALGEKNKNLICQNHGLITCGSNVGEAGAYFCSLEKACQTQMLAEASAANGIEKKFVGDEEAKYTKSWLATPEVMYWWFQPEYEYVLKESQGEFLN